MVYSRTMNAEIVGEFEEWDDADAKQACEESRKKLSKTFFAFK